MARKAKPEEPENHERWLISYADFITLLFAFFVVMYSISSVNEGKYRVLSNSLVLAFSDPQKTLEPIQQGIPLKSPVIQHKSMLADDKDSVPRMGVDYQVVPSPKAMAEMQKISDEVEHDLKELIKTKLVKLYKTTMGLEIEIDSNLLFRSGDVRLSPKAISVLTKIAVILNKTKADINVEGFTDNIPIHTERFPSNWELSSARAASVVRLFARLKINPDRLKAVGFGEYRAIASNDTAVGRKRNRRVTIVVLSVRSDRRQRIKTTLGSELLRQQVAQSISKAFGTWKSTNTTDTIHKPTRQPLYLIPAPLQQLGTTKSKGPISLPLSIPTLSIPQERSPGQRALPDDNKSPIVLQGHTLLPTTTTVNN